MRPLVREFKASVNGAPPQTYRISCASPPGSSGDFAIRGMRLDDGGWVAAPELMPVIEDMLAAVRSSYEQAVAEYFLYGPADKRGSEPRGLLLWNGGQLRGEA